MHRKRKVRKSAPKYPKTKKSAASIRDLGAWLYAMTMDNQVKVKLAQSTINGE